MINLAADQAALFGQRPYLPQLKENPLKNALIAMLVLVICLIPLLGLAEPPVPATPTPIQSPSPMMEEINATMLLAKDQVTELSSRLETATTNQQIQAIQKEVEMVKFQSRLETLQIQLRYAQTENRLENTAKLEAAIENLMHHNPAQIHK